MDDRAKKIIEACLQEKSTNPIDIFYNIARMDFVRIHGPEHHVLDGAALLTAFYNAGGQIDLLTCLNELMKRGCNVGCPFIDREIDDNWGLDDPTGKSDEEFKIIIKEIEGKILELKDKERMV